MNRIDIINQVKQAAINVMQDRRVLASVLIAESVLISEPYKEITANNPFRFRSIKTDALLGFKSLEDCFNHFIDSGIIENGRSNIIGNYDYKSLVKLLRLGETNENSLIEIIESYKLNEIDLEIIHNMYDGRRTMVEINTEPFIDCYKVRAAFGSDKTEKLVTFDKQEAIEECKKYYGYSVFNSRGKVVFDNQLTEKKKAKIELDDKVNTSINLGTKIYLNCVNLYETPDSKIPSRSITGFYFISDNKRYNNRYMITNKPENVGNAIYTLGYINASDKQ